MADASSFGLLPSIPLPSANSYLKFSLFLFCSGFLYFYKVCETFLLSSDFTPATNTDGGEMDQNLNGNTMAFADKAHFLMTRHKLFFYVLMNSCCALLTLTGKILMVALFQSLSPQESALVQKTLRRFIQLKLTFLVFISHHNLIEDTMIWLPWLALHLLFVILLELANVRMTNSFSAVSNKRVRSRLYITNSIACFGSIFMMAFIVQIRSHLSINYMLFLLADCALLFVQSAQQLFKLLVVLNENSPRLHSSTMSYYVDLSHDIFHDSIEFINYMHMIFFSQLAVTYCCIFLMVQARHYYFRLSTKIRKHLKHQRIVYHISTCYPEANDEDLKRNDTCTVCWEQMRSARRLPCGHIFHELCLRRWLEQDSSCAICRQTLSLNINHLREDGSVPDETTDPTLQYVVEALSPQSNGFARWWARLLFSSFSDEQINGMIGQIAEMFPQTPRATIQDALGRTGSVSMAVELLLENRQNQAEENAPNEAGDQVQDGDVSSQSASDSESESENVDESVNADRFGQPVWNQCKNTWFAEQARVMVELNKKQYLQSNRAVDIRHQYL